VQALARQHTPAAIAALVKALANERERVPAAQALLDRAWGKPIQPTDVTSNGETTRFVILGAAEIEDHDEWIRQCAPKQIITRQ
jgi:hypothetical protein